MSASHELQQLLATPPPTLAPHLVHQPVAVAHARLEALRDAGDPSFLFIRTVIELNANVPPEQQELMFHCLTGVRQVVLVHWLQYSAPFLARLRDYLMVLGHSISFRTGRLACYTAVAAMWKRRWNDETAIHGTATSTTILTPSSAEEALLQLMSTANAPHLESKESLFSYIESIMSTQVTEASQFLDILVSEFGARSAVNYRLPIEFHKEAHRSFEKDGPLTQCLRLGMNALSSIVVEARNQEVSPGIAAKASAVIQLCSDCLSWEFGMTAFDMSLIGTIHVSRILLRPPAEWCGWIAQADFLAAMFALHDAFVGGAQHADVAQSIRQFLLLLASISSAVFESNVDSQRYASCLLEGSQRMLTAVVSSAGLTESSHLLDTIQLIGRILSNFRLSSLIELPLLVPVLQIVTATGVRLLEDHVKECEQAQGDVDSMEHRDWREEALSLILECTVTLSTDPWILYSGTEESRKQAQVQMASVLGPLYEGFVACRTKMAALEEHFLATQEAEFDEVREAIEGVDLDEEMCSVATLGRLHLRAAVNCLSNHIAQIIPQLHGVWSSKGALSPQYSAVLEQARMLCLYLGNLLTDDNQGETPSIPDAVIIGCEADQSLTIEIVGAVSTLVQLADSQVKKIAEDASNMHLSPLLATSFVWFFHRWAPSYIYPSLYNSSNTTNSIVHEWSTPEKSQQAISFCISLCTGYLTSWPHETALQDGVAQLLLALSKRKEHVRPLLVASPPFRQLVQLHCLTAGIRHSASRAEVEASITSKQFDLSALPANAIWGYHRLPYKRKSTVLTSLVVGCSASDSASTSLLNDALKVVHESFTSLVQALKNKQVSVDDVHAKEMANLCVLLFGGTVRAGDMAEPSRIPEFLSNHLTDLSALMSFYAADLSICENLIDVFRDYTEQFLAYLDRNQSQTLFNATGELLKAYSEHHIQFRVVTKQKSAESEAKEEQAYSDIQSTIQLLTNLGTKDFLDLSTQGDKVDSTSVTDLIFFGLQRILPLMTQGLLQYPALCRQFFDLLGFVMETYAQRVCALPFDLFNSLLEAVLFGISNHDPEVGKTALQGMAGLIKEHIESHSLQGHLNQHPDILDRCSSRLLTEVVFVQVVVDRLEAAGSAVLALAASDVNRFAAVVNSINQQVSDPIQKVRLESAFTQLIQPDVISQVSARGHEGRRCRIQFKESFQVFVNDVHSFLILK